MNLEFFIIFSYVFKKYIDKIGEKINESIKKINFKCMIYYCILMNGNRWTYSISNTYLDLYNISNVDDSYLKKMRNKIHPNNFERLNNKLMIYFYKQCNNNVDRRIVGIDGTQIQIPIELKKYGFHTNSKKTYCKALISSLFDINNRLVINYNVSKIMNEREALLEHAYYLSQNDILIMDRGYYSKDLLLFFNVLSIDVIFRLSKNISIVKKLIKKNQESTIVNIKCQDDIIIKFRVLVYQINDKKYYLGTTIFNHTISYFKNIYWKRWKIEINFRYSKYMLSLNNLSSKNEIKILQDVYTVKLIFIIIAYFRFFLRKQIDKNDEYDINIKLLTHFITHKLLHYSLFKSMTLKRLTKINKIFKNIIKRPVMSKKNRNYDRVRKKPLGKWYYTTIKRDKKK